MNKKITNEILEQHFRYFTFSLFRFPEKYLPLIFQKDAVIPKHIVYLCPLCLENFIIDFGKGQLSSTDFSLDHFPPESVGGTLKIITCKKCNNEAGSLYEAELAIKMNFEASKNGIDDALIKAKFEAKDLPKHYKSFIKKNNKREIILDFSTKAKNKNPFLKNWLEITSKTNDWEGKLTIQRPDDKKILKAILKAAYIICFINWGYEFVFSTNGELIRNVLSDKEEYPMQFPFWFDENNLANHIQIPLGLHIIEKPLELQTFVVNIPLKLSGYSSIASVLIPYPGELGWNRLIEISKYQKSEPIVEISFRQVIASVPNNIFDGYSKTWNDFISNQANNRN